MSKLAGRALTSYWFLPFIPMTTFHGSGKTAENSYFMQRHAVYPILLFPVTKDYDYGWVAGVVQK